ncbi:hypothetical protein [Brevibacillus dissolubilis]|uniref:hypothetical protein n=1 Tax=Brevibacillus dissolubilis TaxID=1844116 RepID=UPI00111616E7|nr:hypothetical protein [Brevibacillus dissolubilis]
MKLNRLFKKPLMTFLMFTALGFGASSAYAVYFSWKWPVSTYIMYFADGYFGTAATNGAENSSLLQSAANDWRAVGAKIYPITTSYENSSIDVRVYYYPDEYDTSNYGQARLYDNNYNLILDYHTSTPVSGEILIWKRNWDDMSVYRKEYILLHEMGHTLGLAHVEDGVADTTASVMDEDDTAYLAPTAYDKTELINRYGKVQ